MSRPTRSARVVARLRTGKPIEEAVRDVTLALAAAGWSVAADVVKTKGQLRRRTRRAVERGAGLVVVVGGDGAVGQVATKLAGSGVTLGVVPTGTGNLFAGNLGIPTERADAIRTIVEGRVRALDVGMAEFDGKRRAFTIACGIGFDAEVMDATSRPQKLRWGQLAYIANAVGQASDLRNVPHTLTLDGSKVELEAAQVFVANLGRMLPMLEPKPPVIPDDGELDVIAILAGGPLPAIVAGWEAMRQDGLGMSGGGHVYRARARTVRIETKKARQVELDGSAVGSTPVEAAVVPGGLCVLVPAS
jgi:YegS/Rv2252/BmrU family lipid kinase